MADASPNPTTPVQASHLPHGTAIGILLFCVVALGILFVAIADPWTRTEAQIGTSRAPVVVMLSPAHARSAGAEGMKALGNALSDRTGLTIEVRAAKTPLDAINAFAGEADVGLLGLFEYLLARSEHGVEAALQVLRRDQVDSFRGVIVVRSDARTQKITELDHTKVAFVDEYSTSGFVFPMKLFADKQIQVEIHFAGSHPAVLDCLRSNTAAAGATYADAVAGRPEFRAIETTPPIPNEPIFFRKDFEPEKRERLCSAIEFLAGTDTGRELLSKFADVTGVRRTTDAHYQDVLAVIAATGRTIYEIVPDGLTLEARRRYLDLAPR